jgi:hypothetical protein
MGKFCSRTGYTPAEFWEMTNEEVQYITKELNKKNG